MIKIGLTNLIVHLILAEFEAKGRFNRFSLPQLISNMQNKGKITLATISLTSERVY